MSIGAILLVVLVLFSPLSSHKVNASEFTPEQRASMLAQIQSLLELIKKLQAQIDAKKSVTKNNPSMVTLIVPYGPPTAKGELSVEQVGPSTLKLSGKLYPPTDCLTDKTNKIFEFKLTYQDGDAKTYKLNNCKAESFSETRIYTPSLIPAFPELTYRRVEVHNNTWMNYTQVRYKVDLSNPYKIGIQKLLTTGQQKG